MVYGINEAINIQILLRKQVSFSVFVKKPSNRKQIDSAMNPSGLTREQNRSAIKKCLNFTVPKGEMII